MVEAVNKSSNHINPLRNEEIFWDIFSEADAKCDEYQLDVNVIEIQRGSPRRYTGGAAEYQTNDAEEHYRKAYFEFLDAIIAGLADRYDHRKSGLGQYQQLEKMLLSGIVVEDVIARYPELDVVTLPVQLEMFKQTYSSKSLHEAKLVYRTMAPTLFPQVLILLKLLLVCPVTSCECERSFSAWRRLKTWLRCTMAQQRLNRISFYDFWHFTRCRLNSKGFKGS